MIVHMNQGVSEEDSQVKEVVDKATRYGLVAEVHAEKGTATTVVEIYLKDGESTTASSLPEYIFENMDGVQEVVRASVPKVSAYMNGDKERHTFQIGDDRVGPYDPCLLVAGQCSIDKHIGKTVEGLAEIGIKHVRGCYLKPRSKAEAFRGFGIKAFDDMLHAGKLNGLSSLWTEVIESPDIDEVRRHRDKSGFEGEIVLWVGARNLGNYRLLQKLGEQKDFPVMLKHSLNCARIEDLVEQASFVLHGSMWWNEDGSIDKDRSHNTGNDRLIFCVRGLNKPDSYDKHRFYPNLSWISELQQRTWAPVCLDPSHMGGRPDLVLKDLGEGLEHSPDIVMVECHVDPNQALTDRDQALSLKQMVDVKKMIDRHNAVLNVA